MLRCAAMLKCRSASAAILFALPVLCIVAAGCGSTESESSLLSLEPVRCPGANLILVSIDTLRADRLSCYGYERNTSPNIDTIARRSIIFDNHMTNMTTTLPAHASLFTGVHPRTHGALRNGVQLDSRFVTLAEILKENGYTTAAVAGAAPLSTRNNIFQGFDFISEVSLKQLQVDARDVQKRAVPWLRENKDVEKFFLFLHFFDPHSPREPPEEFSPWEIGVKNSLDRERDRYDGEVLFVDHVLGEILRLLKELNLYDKTLIVITSDHGESLGDHNFWGHGRDLHEASLRIPLILRFPSSAGVRPQVVDHPSSIVDLFPTLLNCLEIEYEVEHEALDLFSGAFPEREYVFAQRQYFAGQDNKEMRPIGLWNTMDYGDKYAVRSAEWKYILRTRFEDEFYNIQEDPEERNNLLEKGQVTYEETEPFRRLIGAWQEGAIRGNESMLEVDEETQEMLEALGYIN